MGAGGTRSPQPELVRHMAPRDGNLQCRHAWSLRQGEQRLRTESPWCAVLRRIRPGTGRSPACPALRCRECTQSTQPPLASSRLLPVARDNSRTSATLGGGQQRRRAGKRKLKRCGCLRPALGLPTDGDKGEHTQEPGHTAPSDCTSERKFRQRSLKHSGMWNAEHHTASTALRPRRLPWPWGWADRGLGD